jgi:hypothetical protein
MAGSCEIPITSHHDQRVFFMHDVLHPWRGDRLRRRALYTDTRPPT